ncbi:FtsX-like permease family protein [Butyrivibrio sp. WCE2006]|uniref:FtsX-like permease family protein n=1 Tax=Butyrivibrio sp. WCE2006 TaxID=1410611 RepID=UPI0018CC13F2|nr:FtsX-like permease family protein [Butyrivibrio sp. WCE2006]
MKKIHLTDSLRNIRKQLVAWFSIIVVASFATAAYLGLTYSSFGLKSAAETVYTQTNFRDIQISSNCMLSESDLSEIDAIDGITTVEGRLRSFAKLKTDESTTSITAASIPEKIGIPTISLGKLPQKSNECIIEEILSQKLSINVGDTIQIKDQYDEDPPELNENSFLVTGTFTHAEHLTYDLDESYCVLVPIDAFDSSKFDNCYSYAEVIFDKPSGVSYFSDVYFNLADEYIDKIEALGEKLAPVRYNNYVSFMNDQLKDSEKELSDASSDLELAGRMVSSLNGKTGEVMADLGNMLSVIISKDPVEYKTADEQISDYEKGVKEYDHAVDRVEDTRENHNKTVAKGEGIWYVFNRNANPSFTYTKNNFENLRNLNMTFSLLFVLISVMVVFVSLSRMVFEQRSIIGISKALGMHSSEIFAKYLIFGLSAAMIGAFLGILLSLYIIEPVIALGYGDHFFFGRFKLVVEITPTIVTIIIALIVAILAIYFSCGSLMQDSAQKLLSERVPKGHLKALEKSPFLRMLPLYSRIILLNMRSDIIRVIVTILSVAGCCSLTLIGLTLRASINGSLERQVNDYTGYDAKITINTSVSKDVTQKVSTLLDKHGISYLLFLDKKGNVQIDDTTEYIEFLLSDDLNLLSYYHPIIDHYTNSDLLSMTATDKAPDPNNGLLITTKMSEIYNLAPGDSIYVLDDLGYKHSAVISGVINNYLGRYIISTKSYYEQVVNTNYNDSTFFITFSDKAKENKLIDELSNISGFEAYTPASEEVESLQNIIIVLNLIVVLLIVLSGIMAFFVILGLANMYLVSKKGELTIMRINGYTIRETIVYAIREVVFTTSAGIILGIILGCIMALYILRTMEQLHYMFLRTPDIPSCIISFIITTIFSVGIYSIAMSKIKDLSLNDF